MMNYMTARYAVLAGILGILGFALFFLILFAAITAGACSK
jgi:hypothetical protein